jgi:hypothetical protein
MNNYIPKKEHYHHVDTLSGITGYGYLSDPWLGSLLLDHNCCTSVDEITFCSLLYVFSIYAVLSDETLVSLYKFVW